MNASNPKPARIARLAASSLLLLLVIALTALLVDRWLGRRSLQNWRQTMSAKGEKLNPEDLWPTVSTQTLEFSNRLALATSKPFGALVDYIGQIKCMVPGPAGTWRRGSQEPQPVLPSKPGRTNSWQDLDTLLRQREADLTRLRELMKSPDCGNCCEATKYLNDEPLPNYISVRTAAQTLHTAAMNDLHKNDLSRASEDLISLLSFPNVHRSNPSLVSYMIRIAILGLSTDVCWDALQADGWTDDQLGRIQAACIDADSMLAEMPRTMEAERVVRMHQLNWFRSHSYERWIARHQEVFESFGCSPPASDVSWNARTIRQYFFHPLWSFAWADREDLTFLQNQQKEIEALRYGVQQRSLASLQERMDGNRAAYRPPAGSWRFYGQLPLVDNFCDAMSGSKAAKPAYPYPDFSRAWSTTMKHLTLLELARTSIALKRHELKYRKAPANLAALVPEFLNTVPCDFMDGQPLRYRANPDGSFVLYSVGDNIRDDGGDPTPGSLNRSDFSWTGKDWVWPRAQSGGHASSISRARLAGQPQAKLATEN